MPINPPTPTRPRRRAAGCAASALVLGLAGLIAAAPDSTVRAATDEIRVLTLDGIINPVSARYVVRSIEQAEEEGAVAVIVELDTPGGLLDSTREMIGSILNADVPVVVYVQPPGARAASAGVFVTMAAHLAAMAPNTTIGAATPVSGEGDDLPQDLRAKVINDAVAYIRTIAEERGRNADWAEEAVRDAVVVDADEALELGAIDVVADDRGELIRIMDGREVDLQRGASLTMETEGASVVEMPMSPFEEFLLILSDPNIAFLLLSLGAIGIYFELSNPGSLLPGIAGAIFLILALFSLGTLPINYAGLALLLLGLALLGAEIWVTSGGILGVGGAVAFLLGGLLLIDDTQAPFLEVSRPLIYGITLGLAAFVLFVLRAVLRTRRRPAFIGGNDVVGLSAVVRSPNTVFIEGELWRAKPLDEATTKLEAGSHVRVVERRGLALIVAPDASPEIDNHRSNAEEQ